MKEIKIDKFKFDQFLITVENFVKDIKNELLSEDQISEKNYILNFIETENKKRTLMEARRLYYSFYKINKEKNPKTALEMYNKYKETQEEINKIKDLERGNL